MKLFRFLLCLAMTLSASSMAFANTTFIDNSATPFVPQSLSAKETLNNNTSYLSNYQAYEALNHLKNYWALAYPNHSFVPNSVTLQSESVSSASSGYTYKITAIVDATATLTTTAENHPMLQGMQLALADLSAEEADLIRPSISRYEETLVNSHNVGYSTTAIYQMIYSCDFNPKTTTNFTLPTPTCYYGQTTATTNTRMPHLTSYLTGEERFAQQKQQGYEAATSLVYELQIQEAPLRDVTYDITLATEYAKAHAMDIPEYSAANGLGSDCANFVSFCIMAGGIEADTEGEWYPSSRSGGYGSGNWIRTGYTPSIGGVTIYMNAQNLFFKQANPILVPAGSVMFYTNASHVAMITHTDGELTIFADRSNTPKYYNNFLQEGNLVNYFSPHPDIIV